jgi:hypothetical protein
MDASCQPQGLNLLARSVYMQEQRGANVERVGPG